MPFVVRDGVIKIWVSVIKKSSFGITYSVSTTTRENASLAQSFRDLLTLVSEQELVSNTDGCAYGANLAAFASTTPWNVVSNIFS